jgi:hypothetical protein
MGWTRRTVRGKLNVLARTQLGANTLQPNTLQRDVSHQIWLQSANLNISLLYGIIFYLIICGGVHCWVAARSIWTSAASLPKLRVQTPTGTWMSVSSAVCCQRRLWQTDHSYRGVVQSVVCLSAISKPRQGGGLSKLGLYCLQQVG